MIVRIPCIAIIRIESKHLNLLLKFFWCRNVNRHSCCFIFSEHYSLTVDSLSILEGYDNSNESTWLLWDKYYEKKKMSITLTAFLTKSDWKIYFTSSTYNCFSIKGVKYITKLRLGLSHLHVQKCKHGFLDIETICHYLIHCPNFINGRLNLLNTVSRLNKNI